MNADERRRVACLLAAQFKAQGQTTREIAARLGARPEAVKEMVRVGQRLSQPDTATNGRDVCEC